MEYQKRIPQGRPLTGENFRSADAIALLAGVNLGSVVKVLAAIEAIRIHTGARTDDIVRFSDIPTEPVRFDGSCETRVVATDHAVAAIARNPAVSFLNYILRFKQRFCVPTL